MMRVKPECDSIQGVREPSILIINRVLPPHRGATGRRVAELAPRLAAAGWRVTLLTTQGGAGAAVPGVTVVVARGREPAGALGYAAALLGMAVRALTLPRHDVAVTMTDPPFLAVLGPVLAAMKGSRTLHWCHDLYPDLFPLIGRPLPAPFQSLARWLMRQALCGHDAVVAIGSCMARRLAAAGVEPARLRIVANWADARIVPDPEGALSLRRELGVEGRFVVGYAGNFGLAHPLASVLAAAERLAGASPPIHFLLSGEGRARAAIEAEVARRRLGNVTLLPWQPDIRLPALLGVADLHLAAMAEPAEGLMVPNKVAGALAAGRPCLLLGPARSDAAALALASGGAVLPPDDALGLADAILSHAARGPSPPAVPMSAHGLPDLDAAVRGFLEVLDALSVRCPPRALPS
jgi:colanic acid biosynthesis glycosyl transferase WcaI